MGLVALAGNWERIQMGFGANECLIFKACGAGSDVECHFYVENASSIAQCAAIWLLCGECLKAACCLGHCIFMTMAIRGGPHIGCVALGIQSSRAV